MHSKIFQKENLQTNPAVSCVSTIKITSKLAGAKITLSSCTEDAVDVTLEELIVFVLNVL